MPSRRSRTLRPVVGDIALEPRIALSGVHAAIQAAKAKGPSAVQKGKFVDVNFSWNTRAGTVAFQSVAPGTINGLGQFDAVGEFRNVKANRAGQIKGDITLTLTSVTNPASTLVFSVKGPSPTISPNAKVATQEKLTLTSATGDFAGMTNRPGSVGTIVMPRMSLPAKVPAQIDGVATLKAITINYNKS
ncbi:MAG: hypothetical protein U0800_12975 [Isosphaeraceae bacterium]